MYLCAGLEEGRCGREPEEWDGSYAANWVIFSPLSIWQIREELEAEDARGAPQKGDPTPNGALTDAGL